MLNNKLTNIFTKPLKHFNPFFSCSFNILSIGDFPLWTTILIHIIDLNSSGIISFNLFPKYFITPSLNTILNLLITFSIIWGPIKWVNAEAPTSIAAFLRTLFETCLNILFKDVVNLVDLEISEKPPVKNFNVVFTAVFIKKFNFLFFTSDQENSFLPKIHSTPYFISS